MQEKYSISPLVLCRSLKAHRGLLLSLIKREVIGRYQGSTLGMIWSFLTPMLMLLVYTFFFSVVFKARWPGESGSKTEFALILFAGLLIFNVFAECIGRAPSLIVSNVNYVKKIIFPLEILPLVSLGTAGFHFLISFIVWLGFYGIFFGLPSSKIIYFPFILIPFCLLILGVSWMLASLGVYLRDVSQIVTALIPALMFMSPVFFPVTALPVNYHFLFEFNPLTFVIEQTRSVLIWQNGLEWYGWIRQLIISYFVAWLGYAWFQRTRKGFADVL